MAATRSMRNGSVIGLTLAANTTKASMLATAGRTKQLRRGSTFSTIPFPRSTVMFTMSPVRGVQFSFRRMPRARQVITPSPVCTS